MTFEVPTPDDIRTARKDAGLTQTSVAEEADISQAMLSRLEDGNVDPTLSTVQKIAVAIERLE